MSKSILDAMLAQYVTPYVGGQGTVTGNMVAPQGGGPGPDMGFGQQPPQQMGPQPPQQMGPQPGPMAPQPGPMAPQGAPQPPPNPLSDVESALASGMNTDENQALAAFEAGAQPFEDKWAATQSRRFGGTAGGIEAIVDMVREKKMRPERQAMNEARSRLTREAQIKQADQKYKDAKEIFKSRSSNMTEDEADAAARLYAQGEDLNKVMPDFLTEYEKAQLKLKKQDSDRLAHIASTEAAQALTDEQKKQSNAMWDDSKPYRDRYAKAQETQNRLLAVKEDYARNPAPVDIQGMYDFIKSIDPDSVVREGEVRLTESGQGYQTMLQNAWDKVSQDQVLTADFMAQIVNQAMNINEKLQQSSMRQLGDIYNRAAVHGIPADLVFGGEGLVNVARQGSEMSQALLQAEPVTGEQLRQAREEFNEGNEGISDYEQWKRERGIE